MYYFTLRLSVWFNLLTMKATGIRIVLIVLAHAFIICAGDSDASSRSEKKSKGVTTFVSAKWEATPLVLELAEYMSGESADLFWSYFDGIISLKSSLSALGKQTFNSYSVNEPGSCLPSHHHRGSY